MAFVPAPNIVMVEVRATLEGQQIENRFNINAQEAVTPTIVNDITNVVNNWAITQYFDWLPVAVQLRETVGTDLTVQNGDQVTLVPEAPVVGAVGGAQEPNEVTICVSLRSGLRGRSARGRSYVFALPKVQVSGNVLSETWIDGFVTSYQILIDALATNGTPLTIVSYRTNNAPRPGGPVYFAVTTALIVDPIVDSMRRRKPGVGS